MENKTGKYLKYAIGEIVLVVIGILIALQVNNWNNLKQERKAEVAILREIYSNLQEDGAIIQAISIKRQKSDAAVLRLLEYIHEPDIDEEMLSQDLSRIFTFERYYPIRNGYERSKYSDASFSDDVLTNKISRYYEYEQNRANSSIQDIEIFFTSVFQMNDGIRTHLDRMEKDKIVKVKDINAPEFKEDLLNELITFRDNNQGTMETVMAFEAINIELTRLVGAKINGN